MHVKGKSKCTDEAHKVQSFLVVQVKFYVNVACAWLFIACCYLFVPVTNWPAFAEYFWAINDDW